MKEQLISLEMGKLAKEKGFNIPVKIYLECNSFKPSHSNKIQESRFSFNWNMLASTSIPTQSLLQRWLREFHNLDVNVITKHKDLGKFYGGFIDTNNNDINKSYGSNFKTYEEALEKGLEDALKLIE